MFSSNWFRRSNPTPEPRKVDGRLVAQIVLLLKAVKDKGTIEVTASGVAAGLNIDCDLARNYLSRFVSWGMIGVRLKPMDGVEYVFFIIPEDFGKISPPKCSTP